VRGKVRPGLEVTTVDTSSPTLAVEVTIGLPVADHFPSYIPITSGEKAHQVDGLSLTRGLTELNQADYKISGSM